MASILIVTRGLPGVLYQSVELARRLAAAGHRLTFAGDPDARELVEHHGLAFHRLDPDRYEQFLEEDAATPALGRILDIGRRRERARESLGIDAFARFVRDDRPDLILINGEMHEHIIAAATAGSRLALLNPFASIWRHPGVPPPHTLARPGIGWSGSRPGAALLWRALWLRKQYRRWAGRVRRIGCDRVSVYRDLARTVGFAFERETDDRQWLIPFTYRHLPVLSLHALEFEFPHHPPAHVRFVGPMVLESRIDQPQAPADRDRLEAILARRRRAGTDGRLIYAGFGSVFSTDLAFLRRLLGIVEERPGWELVVTLSHRVPRSALGPLPARRPHVPLGATGARAPARRCCGDARGHQHDRRVRAERRPDAPLLRLGNGHGGQHGPRRAPRNRHCRRSASRHDEGHPRARRSPPDRAGLPGAREAPAGALRSVRREPGG